jgi:outer membrane protein assembly factor BamB
MSTDKARDDGVASGESSDRLDGDVSIDETDGGKAGPGPDRRTRHDGVHRRRLLATTAGTAGALALGAAPTTTGARASDSSASSIGSATPSEWAMDGYDLRNTRFPRDSSAITESVETVWEYNVGVDQGSGDSYKTGRIQYAPVTIVDGMALVGDGALTSNRTYLHAIDVETGEQVWRKRMPELNTGVAVGDGRVYVGGRASYVAGLDLETGRELWKWGTKDYVKSSPKYHDGSVYVGANDGTFYALDPEQGFRQWKFETADDADGLHIFGSQPHADGRVYLNTWAPDDQVSYVYGIDKRTGREEWRYQLSDEGGGGASPLAVGADHVFVPDATRGQLLAFERGSHQLRWQKGGFQFGPRTGAAVADCRVVVGSLDGHVTAVNVENGEWAWRADTRAGVEMPPVVANGTVYVTDRQGWLYGFAIRGGGKRFEAEVGNAALTTPRVYDGDLVLATSRFVKRLTGDRADYSVTDVCASAETTATATESTPITESSTAASGTTSAATATEPAGAGGDEDDESDGTDVSSGGSPGFGVVAGVTGVAAVARALARRAVREND